MNELENNESALAVIEDVETSVIELNYPGQPMDRALVVEFGDTLMGIHPNAGEVGLKGMRTVAQLALVTGANPLPGTNGIHSWRDKKNRLCIQFGIGYWRGKADAAGGIMWTDRPRIMTDEEREVYGITEAQKASYCCGALTRDVFDLVKRARDMDLELSIKEAKQEVSRVGIGIVNPKEYAKNGRPPQWTADIRAERDLLRQLVPALVPDKHNADKPEGGQDWNLASYTRQHLEPQELPDGYGIEDANGDFFEDDPLMPIEGEPDTVAGEVEEGDIGSPKYQITPPPPATEPDANTQPANGSGKQESHQTADIRASIEGMAQGGKVSLGTLNAKLAQTEWYTSAPHAFNAVKMWEGWPNGKEGWSVDSLHGGTMVPLDKVVSIFDWAVERKQEGACFARASYPWLGM